MATQPLTPADLQAAYASGKSKWDAMSSDEQEAMIRASQPPTYNPDMLKRLGEASGGEINQTAGPRIGKDDGIIPVQRGEFVIKKSAVVKYGIDLLTAINDGRARITVDDSIRGHLERAASRV